MTDISQCSGGNHLIVDVALPGGATQRLHVPWVKVEEERLDDPTVLLLTLVRNDVGRYLSGNPGAGRAALRNHLLSLEYFI